jgi:hypothetical protein
MKGNKLKLVESLTVYFRRSFAGKKTLRSQRFNYVCRSYLVSYEVKR